MADRIYKQNPGPTDEWVGKRHDLQQLEEQFGYTTQRPSTDEASWSEATTLSEQRTEEEADPE